MLGGNNFEATLTRGCTEGNMPGGHGGSRCGDEGRTAGIATAQRHAVVAAAPARAGHPGWATTLAGDNANAGAMTMGTAHRKGRHRGKIS